MAKYLPVKCQPNNAQIGPFHITPVIGLAMVRFCETNFVVCSYGKFQPGRQETIKKVVSFSSLIGLQTVTKTKATYSNHVNYYFLAVSDNQAKLSKFEFRSILYVSNKVRYQYYFTYKSCYLGTTPR